MIAVQGSLDVADAAVSPRRAAAARDDVTEDEWTQGHRPDPLGAIKTGRHVVRAFIAKRSGCSYCLRMRLCMARQMPWSCGLSATRQSMR